MSILPTGHIAHRIEDERRPCFQKCAPASSTDRPRTVGLRSQNFLPNLPPNAARNYRSWKIPGVKSSGNWRSAAGRNGVEPYWRGARRTSAAELRACVAYIRLLLSGHCNATLGKHTMHKSTVVGGRRRSKLAVPHVRQRHIDSIVVYRVECEDSTSSSLDDTAWV